MLTINDLISNVNLEESIRVTRWTGDDCIVLFDGDGNVLNGVDEEWMNTEIRFMFAITEADGTAKIVIEVV